MTYENALKFIHSLDTFGSRPGLDRIKRLLCKMGNPQNELKFIHVAGTNGKGSVCAMLSAILIDAGYKTGLFISPYITDFCERIQINGTPVSKQLLADAVENTSPILLKLQKEGCIITEFEYVMALQFYIHRNACCDVVVLETGMGGLLDCTNVILPPLCCVITTIGLDHTAVLGDTIEKIAVQKCGIIKENSPVVTSAQCTQVMQIIEKTAKNNNSPLIKSEGISLENITQSLDKTEFSYNGLTMTLPLIGNHQIENAKTALATVETLKGTLNISNQNIANGFLNTVNPARFELLCNKPTVILDGAHNPNGTNALKSSIKTYLGENKNICIIGMLSDKDSKGSIKELKGMFSDVFTVPVNNPRSLSADELKSICNDSFDNVTSCESPFDAFDRAFSLAKEKGKALIICGSLYLAGEIRPYIIKKT